MAAEFNKRDSKHIDRPGGQAPGFGNSQARVLQFLASAGKAAVIGQASLSHGCVLFHHSILKVYFKEMQIATILIS